jgi:chemotaxis protein methyltransferase CheR
MTAAKTLNLNQVDLRVLGTDISTKVLDKALAARYPNSALQSIPAQFHNDNYIESQPRNSNEFSINPRLVKLVDFARMNLSVVPYPMKGPFDIIFCRNVMIYFEDAVRQKLVTEFERLLRPNGYLFIGHSESLIGLTTSLVTVKPSIFRKA